MAWRTEVDAVLAAAAAVPTAAAAMPAVAGSVLGVGTAWRTESPTSSFRSIDGNHPLAGIALRLHLKVERVREATVDEVGRGSAGTGFFRLQASAPASPRLH